MLHQKIKKLMRMMSSRRRPTSSVRGHQQPHCVCGRRWSVRPYAMHCVIAFLSHRLCGDDWYGVIAASGPMMRREGPRGGDGGGGRAQVPPEGGGSHGDSADRVSAFAEEAYLSNDHPTTLLLRDRGNDAHGSREQDHRYHYGGRGTARHSSSSDEYSSYSRAAGSISPSGRRPPTPTHYHQRRVVSTRPASPEQEFAREDERVLVSAPRSTEPGSSSFIETATPTSSPPPSKYGSYRDHDSGFVDAPRTARPVHVFQERAHGQGRDPPLRPRERDHRDEFDGRSSRYRSPARTTEAVVAVAPTRRPRREERLVELDVSSPAGAVEFARLQPVQRRKEPPTSSGSRFVRLVEDSENRRRPEVLEIVDDGEREDRPQARVVHVQRRRPPPARPAAVVYEIVDGASSQEDDLTAARGDDYQYITAPRRQRRSFVPVRAGSPDVPSETSSSFVEFEPESNGETLQRRPVEHAARARELPEDEHDARVAARAPGSRNSIAEEYQIQRAAREKMDARSSGHAGGETGTDSGSAGTSTSSFHSQLPEQEATPGGATSPAAQARARADTQAAGEKVASPPTSTSATPTVAAAAPRTSSSNSASSLLQRSEADAAAFTNGLENQLASCTRLNGAAVQRNKDVSRTLAAQPLSEVESAQRQAARQELENDILDRAKGLPDSDKSNSKKFGNAALLTVDTTGALKAIDGDKGLAANKGGDVAGAPTPNTASNPAGEKKTENVANDGGGVAISGDKKTGAETASSPTGASGTPLRDPTPEERALYNKARDLVVNEKWVEDKKKQDEEREGFLACLEAAGDTIESLRARAQQQSDATKRTSFLTSLRNLEDRWKALQHADESLLQVQTSNGMRMKNGVGVMGKKDGAVDKFTARRTWEESGKIRDAFEKFYEDIKPFTSAVTDVVKEQRELQHGLGRFSRNLHAADLSRSMEEEHWKRMRDAEEVDAFYKVGDPTLYAGKYVPPTDLPKDYNPNDRQTVVKDLKLKGRAAGEGVDARR